MEGDEGGGGDGDLCMNLSELRHTFSDRGMQGQLHIELGLDALVIGGSARTRCVFVPLHAWGKFGELQRSERLLKIA